MSVLTSLLIQSKLPEWLHIASFCDEGRSCGWLSGSLGTLTLAGNSHHAGRLRSDPGGGGGSSGLELYTRKAALIVTVL